MREKWQVLALVRILNEPSGRGDNLACRKNFKLTESIVAPVEGIGALHEL